MFEPRELPESVKQETARQANTHMEDKEIFERFSGLREEVERAVGDHQKDVFAAGDNLLSIVNRYIGQHRVQQAVMHYGLTVVQHSTYSTGVNEGYETAVDLTRGLHER